MHRKILGGFIAASLIASMPAMAKSEKKHQMKNRQGQTRQMSMEERWNRLDRNRDGVLSRSEWRGDRSVFDRVDRNNDNVVSKSEARAAKRMQRDSRQMKHRGLDRNGDGMITRSEWRGNDTSFRNQDRNRDGVLSGSELRAGSKRGQDGRFDDDDRQLRIKNHDHDDDDDDDDDRR